MRVYDYDYDMPTLRQKMAVLMPLLISYPALAADGQSTPQHSLPPLAAKPEPALPAQMLPPAEFHDHIVPLQADDAEPAQPHDEVELQQHLRALPGWSYDGFANGQQHWADLSPVYARCDDGHEQSPINLAYTDTTVPLPIITPKYHSAPTRIYQGKHVLQLNMKDGGTLTENGITYTLRHIQFHSPSEHVVKENVYPLEVQFVHEDPHKKLLILSAFALIGDGRAGFDTLLAHIGSKEPFDFDAGSLLPSGGGYYAYDGSLTYPPCLEGVKWRILKQPQSISEAQFRQIGTIVGRNARMPQPIYVRRVAETPQ